MLPMLFITAYYGQGKRCCGRVFNDDRFPDGSEVLTSNVVRTLPGDGTQCLQTRNTTYVIINPKIFDTENQFAGLIDPEGTERFCQMMEFPVRQV